MSFEEPQAIAPAEELTHKCSTEDARKSDTNIDFRHSNFYCQNCVGCGARLDAGPAFAGLPEDEDASLGSLRAFFAEPAPEVLPDATARNSSAAQLR